MPSGGNRDRRTRDELVAVIVQAAKTLCHRDEHDAAIRVLFIHSLVYSVPPIHTFWETQTDARKLDDNDIENPLMLDIIEKIFPETDWHAASQR